MTLLAKSVSLASPEGLSLRQHLLDVVNAVSRLELRHPSLPSIAGVPNLFRILRSAALLHDLGKAHPGFQQMLTGGPRFNYRHEIFSLAFSWADPLLFPSDWSLIHIAVVTHHKDFSEIQSRYPTFDPGEPLKLPLPAEFLAAGHGLLTKDFFHSAGLSEAEAPQSPPSSAAANSRITEILESIAQHRDRFASLPFDHPSVLTARFLRGVLILADHSASASQTFTSLSADRVNISLISPYSHQIAAAATVGNAILTAPTGSGKTEAALLWAIAQAPSAQLPLLFYVLPFQASLNAMRQRLGTVMPSDALALQHGKALQSLYLSLLNREYGSQPTQALRLARHERSMGRLQTAPVRILSPYQLLRAAYTLPGHEALWTTPAGSLFILDEIHAYEPGRLAMIVATLRHFSQTLHARFFVMTATMPARLHRLLESILPEPSLIRATPDTFLQAQRHILNLVPATLTSPPIAVRIVDDAKNGLAVLVIANTVARAQALATSLHAATGLPVQLLHSRFHARDRARKETDALTSAALGTVRTSGFILVATQVVEVSLNVDFDTLYTEPAPLEALLQRFGRVNRTPRAHRPLKPVNVCVEQLDSRPYDAEEIQLSLQALTPFHGKPLDESLLQSAIDSVYDTSFGERWERNVTTAMGSFQDAVLNNCKPLDSHPELETAFSELFDGYEVVPASLRQQFDALFADDPILASQLNVPISAAQFHRLRRSGRIARHEPANSWIADVPYTDAGLELNMAR